MDLFLVYVGTVQYYCCIGRAVVLDRKIILTLNRDCVYRLTIGTTVEDAWISWRWVAKCCC